jgi:hypothetical protein
VFGLFKSPPFHDPKLGELLRSRGLWRGLLTLETGVSAPLTLSGTRTEPHAQALAAAREAAQAFPSWRPAIEQALFEHYEPYAEAVTAGELPSPSEALPRIAAPGDVWSHVSLVFVSVTPLSGFREDDAQPFHRADPHRRTPVLSRLEASKTVSVPGS